MFAWLKLAPVSARREPVEPSATQPYADQVGVGEVEVDVEVDVEVGIEVVDVEVDVEVNVEVIEVEA
jgi:hypothetical protein